MNELNKLYIGRSLHLHCGAQALLQAEIRYAARVRMNQMPRRNTLLGTAVLWWHRRRAS